MNELLYQIDEYFKDKKESEVYAHFLLPFLLFGFLTYQFIYPITDNNLNTAREQNKKLNNDLATTKANIAKTQRSINNDIKQIKETKVQIKSLDKDKMKIDELVKILKNSGAFTFDISTFAELYNAIPSYTKKLNLNIKSLDTKFFDQGENLISKRMTVNISLNGDFINILKFISIFENRRELIKVTKLTSDKKEGATIEIEIYGAKL